MAEKNKGGRPTKYTQLDLKKVKAVAERGWTDREMSGFFDVSYATWNAWKLKHPKFLDSLKEWKKNADERVERSLYERAIGYSHPEDKIFCSKDGVVTIVPTIKHYPPDTTACIYWTKNRDRDNWSDRSVLDATINTDIAGQFERDARADKREKANK